MSDNPLRVTPPPTQQELPCDDGTPMESERHRRQMELLIETLEPWLAQRGNGYVGGNMFVYYSLAQLRGQDFRGPDVFVVLDVPPGERRSWVVWEEGKGPDVVIELLSESTAEADKTDKKKIYESRLKVDDYFWFDPFDPEDWAGFDRRGGEYIPLQVDTAGCLPCRSLGLGLARWRGSYRGVDAVWLRWVTPAGELLPTATEQHIAAEQRAERLAARLRSLGFDPDDPDSR